jgi:hypothetical protein
MDVTERMKCNSPVGARLQVGKKTVNGSLQGSLHVLDDLTVVAAFDRFGRCVGAVVPDGSRAGYLVILGGQVGEQIGQVHFANRPLSRPHWTHARDDASMSPASLSPTGFSFVMASSAQNQ